MNILYLKKDELGHPLQRGDVRYNHIIRVLKKKEGDIIAAGCSDGSLGSARIKKFAADALLLDYQAESQAPTLYPVNILMGFPRPIQAGRILKDLTSLGVARIWFTLSALGEKSYAESSFFRTKDFETHLIEGAMQAGNPRLPSVECFWSLARACHAIDSIDAIDAIDAAQRENASRTTTPGVAGHNYLNPAFSSEGLGLKTDRLVFHPGEDLPRLADFSTLGAPLWLAIGSERGWTGEEMDTLQSRGFAACSLGRRILKTETAALAATSIVLGKMGLL